MLKYTIRPGLYPRIPAFTFGGNAMHIALCDGLLPETLSISDTELCSLFSNALENAIFAASKLMEKKARRVYLRTLINNNKLLISTKNAYAGTIHWKENFQNLPIINPVMALGLKVWPPLSHNMAACIPLKLLEIYSLCSLCCL